MSILDKAAPERAVDWDEFVRRMRQPLPNGHRPLTCHWVKDSDGQMMAVWAPEPERPARA